MTINEYLQSVKEIVEKKYTDQDGNERRFFYRKIAPPVVCADGFRMSVQVSDGHYCSPRVLDAEFYSRLEIGYPNRPEELLSEYEEIYSRGIYP